MDGPGQTPLHRTGRVIGRVGDGRTGEVMLAIRGGSETFYAYPLFNGETFNIGDMVLVAEYLPPRTVLVTAAT